MHLHTIRRSLNALYSCRQRKFRRHDLTTSFYGADRPGAKVSQGLRLIKKAKLKVYEGGSHGMCSTQKDQVNEDLLAFFTA